MTSTEKWSDPQFARFLPADFIDGDEWMALRQVAFGARLGVVSPLSLDRLADLGLIDLSVVAAIRLESRLREARFGKPIVPILVGTVPRKEISS